jgi:hypothetical protein
MISDFIIGDGLWGRHFGIAYHGIARHGWPLMFAALMERKHKAIKQVAALAFALGIFQP